MTTLSHCILLSFSTQPWHPEVNEGIANRFLELSTQVVHAAYNFTLRTAKGQFMRIKATGVR